MSCLSRLTLPPPPTIEEIMDDAALTPYHRPDSAFNFEGWQEEQAVPPALQPRDPPPCYHCSLH